MYWLCSRPISIWRGHSIHFERSSSLFVTGCWSATRWRFVGLVRSISGFHDKTTKFSCSAIISGWSRAPKRERRNRKTKGQNDKYSKDLKSNLVWISNGPKEIGLQMVWVSNGILNLEAQPFEIRKNSCHFIKNHLKSGQKSLDFEWSGFWMVWTRAIAIAKAQPFENQTICNPTFKKTGFQMVTVWA